MKLCFPIEKDEGLDSVVYEDFGSAPALLIFDAKTKKKKTINNELQGGIPLKALVSERVDIVIVESLVDGVVVALEDAGIGALQSIKGTVKKNLEAFERQSLPNFKRNCAGHSGFAQ
ncbi:MAG: hypothetical protein M0018_10230 [Nitrospiraceae bacterium]|nr:hypothetical protein [Nitrospiraceae bacterium]